MEIVKADQNDNYEEYERLVLKKDVVKKEAGAAMGAYIREFGELVTAAFQKKIDCISKKKSIAFCQQAINRGERINIAQMRESIAGEMAEYHEQLNEMLAQYEKCKNAKAITELEVFQARSIYRQIAKRIHPDINQKAHEIPEIQELWRVAQLAYKQNNAEELKEIQTLMEIVLKNAGLGGQVIEIPNIVEKIQKLEAEIEEIMTTDPYCYISLLADPEAVEEKKREIREEIEEYTRYEKELDEILQTPINQGGAVMVWQMNYPQNNGET